MNAPNSFPRDEFSKEQQAYLQGLLLGTDVARKVHSLPVLSGAGLVGTGLIGPDSVSVSGAEHSVIPDSLQAQAQRRLEAEGKKLATEEKAKRDKNPLELWSEIDARAAQRQFPKGNDLFLTKYHGLFYVAPAQNAFMCRLRIPGGALRADQLSGLAQVADEYAGGYTDLTTRANLQLREIPPEHATDVLMSLRDLGIVTLGSGADNVRNVTASPLSGIDPSELIETLPLARKLHYHILHRPQLFGLPRKFNIAFDGAGRISSLAETNDISWQAVSISAHAATTETPAGTYFRLGLGGITGHGDFAAPTHVLVEPARCIAVSEAILRVFIAHGDRTDRKRARLKYLLDNWGSDKFLTAVEKELGEPLRRVADACLEPVDHVDRWAHIGVHAQKQAGLSYIGVVVPAGRLSSYQMRGLASISTRYGDGQVRLTVWQNLLIPGIKADDIRAVQDELRNLELDWRTSSFHAGLVACTGNAGCKFAASDTKRHSLLLANYLRDRFQVDQPINIHLTGCHHSCAQHAIGDIGLIATKVAIDDEMVEGYHILVGGRTGMRTRIAQTLFESVPFEEVPLRVASIIAHYLQHREPHMAFADFAAGHDWRGLKPDPAIAVGEHA